MKDIETRKAIQALKKLCKKRGIELTTTSGRGSHVAMVFRDIETDKTLKIVVGGHGTISAGVQRDTITYVENATKWLGVAKLAATVLKILKDVFLGG